MKRYPFFIILASFHVVFPISIISSENNFLLKFDKYLLTFVFPSAILNLSDCKNTDINF